MPIIGVKREAMVAIPAIKDNFDRVLGDGASEMEGCDVFPEWRGC